MTLVQGFHHNIHHGWLRQTLLGGAHRHPLTAHCICVGMCLCEWPCSVPWKLRLGVGCDNISICWCVSCIDQLWHSLHGTEWVGSRSAAVLKTTDNHLRAHKYMLRLTVHVRMHPLVASESACNRCSSSKMNDFISLQPSWSRDSLLKEKSLLNVFLDACLELSDTSQYCCSKLCPRPGSQQNLLSSDTWIGTKNALLVQLCVHFHYRLI